MSNLDTSVGEQPSRRRLLGWIVMGVCLAASYGVAILYALRFLLPVRRERWRELFVATLDELPPGSSRQFVDPAGGEVVVHNLGGRLVALSNVCPHLGCKVHYQASDAQFVCPCHQGVFDQQGQPLAGPPKQGNTPLKRHEVVERSGAAYIRWKEV
jgi:cytochrome b6-f complex iron-sulfur subunit